MLLAVNEDLFDTLTLQSYYENHGQRRISQQKNRLIMESGPWPLVNREAQCPESILIKTGGRQNLAYRHSWPDLRKDLL